MDAELKAALLEQSKLLRQIATDVAAIKTVVLREAKPLTLEQQTREVEALARKTNRPARSKSGS